MAINWVKFIIKPFFALSMPALILFLYLSCNKDACQIPSSFVLPSDPEEYYSVSAFVMFFSWFIAQILLSVIPFGKIIHTKPGQTYRINGLYHLFLSFVALVVIFYYDIPIELILNEVFAFILFSIMFSIVLSLAMFVLKKTGKSASAGKGSNDVRIPFTSVTNIKKFLLRYSLSTLTLLNFALWKADFSNKGCINSSMALCTLLQTLFIFDVFIRESQVLSTAAFRHDTCGYFMIMFLMGMVPFLHYIPTVYLFVYQRPLLFTDLFFCLAIFFLGYYMYYKSTMNKSNSQNVYANAEKIFIQHGFWGSVRHPNYSSFLFIVFSWTFLVGLECFLPWIPFILTVFILAIRAIKQDKTNHDRYKLKWKDYTEKVPYRLIHNIF